MALRKASRQKTKVRIGFSSVSGGGKTVSALLIAYGITGDWGKIAVIDTENKSADLYANHTLPDGTTIGEFMVNPLEAPYTPENYIKAIKECEDEGIEVCIIDSITHEWDGKGGCLEIVDELTAKDSKRNSYTQWAKVTPRHQSFVEAILSSPMHMITTVRRKQDYNMDRDSSGKTVITKAGLKEITREGWEYELTANIELDQMHNATASKDRTGLFAGKPSFIPSIQTGELLREWCETGFDVKAEVEAAIAKLSNVKSREEFKPFSDTLSPLVLQEQKFKDAANQRWTELKPAEK